MSIRCYDKLEAKATGVDGVTKEESVKRTLKPIYAITDNLERCSYYVYRTKHILFKLALGNPDRP